MNDAIDAALRAHIGRQELLALAAAIGTALALAIVVAALGGAFLAAGWRILNLAVFRRSAPARQARPISLDTGANTGRASSAQDQENGEARP